MEDSQGRRPSDANAVSAASDLEQRLVARQTVSGDLLRTLMEASIADCQLVPWGSNYTFAVTFEMDEATAPIAIYKPANGEIPLWDFDSGSLYRREYASYLLSRAIGWHFIPPTVIREGPHGIGTVQLYIEPVQHAQELITRAHYQRALKRMFVFDLLVNNADRKSSHLFIGRKDRRLWGIDHGLTFNVDPKLRTVIWNFCGEPLEPELQENLDRLIRHSSLIGDLLAPYIRDDEIDTLFARARQIRQRDTLPLLNQRRNIPYGW
ncbi:MAG TPA: SCO1664 family protein [Nitrolancea sp.]|nr:SCO1664 family protein [Nitrolancea sp.]